MHCILNIFIVSGVINIILLYYSPCMIPDFIVSVQYLFVRDGVCLFDCWYGVCMFVCKVHVNNRAFFVLHLLNYVWITSIFSHTRYYLSPHTMGYFRGSGGRRRGDWFLEQNTLKCICLVFHGENGQNEYILIIFSFTTVVSIVACIDL